MMETEKFLLDVKDNLLILNWYIDTEESYQRKTAKFERLTGFNKMYNQSEEIAVCTLFKEIGIPQFKVNVIIDNNEEEVVTIMGTIGDNREDVVIKGFAPKNSGFKSFFKYSKDKTLRIFAICKETGMSREYVSIFFTSDEYLNIVSE